MVKTGPVHGNATSDAGKNSWINGSDSAERELVKLTKQEALHVVDSFASTERCPG